VLLWWVSQSCCSMGNFSFTERSGTVTNCTLKRAIQQFCGFLFT
jgi:hypothetical protein